MTIPTIEIPYKRLPSGLLIPEYIRPKRERPTVFDFFAGCGGMGLGFLQAGFEVVGANEFDPWAALTYMTNLGAYPIQIHYIGGAADKERLNKAVMKSWGVKKGDLAPDGSMTEEGAKRVFSRDQPGLRAPNQHNFRGSGFSGSGWISSHPDTPPVRNFWFGDVRKLRGQDILDALDMNPGDLDCVAGGPPCQGFSRAGKQQIVDPRNNLVYEYARLITELQPKTFIMEEVPDIVNFFDQDGVTVLDKFCMLLQDGGYGKYQTIRKSLMMQTGMAMAMNGRGNENGIKEKKPKGAQKAKPKAKPAIVASQDHQEQLSLF